MRPATRVLLCCAWLFLLSGLIVGQGTKVSTTPASDRERDDPQARARWFLRGRSVNGRPAPELLHRAYQQKLNNRILQRKNFSGSNGVVTSETSAAQANAAAATTNFVQTTGGAPWVPLGPAPTGTAAPGDLTQDYGPAVGRGTVVVVDQADATGNTVYFGGASGGLWKSTNAADPAVFPCTGSAPYCAPNVSWTPLIDNQPTLTVGAMAIKPDNRNWLLVGTGEANNSADSYYGLGFLLSQDGGATWQSITSATGTGGSGAIDLHGLGTTRIAFSTDNTSLVVATMAAASGGITVGAEFGGSNARGIYFSIDGGQHWQRASVSDGGGVTPSAGSANSVIYNSFTHQFYANIRWHGFYSSPDGANWTRLANQPGGTTLNINGLCPATTSQNCPLYRAEMAIVPGRAGANNAGEMYVWIVDVNDNDKGIFQSRDGGSTWTAISTNGIDNCGDGAGNGCGTGSSSQASYNISLAAVPNGTTATDLYAGGVNQYKCSIDPVTNPTCAAKPFANLTHTYASCAGAVGDFAHVHPDEHGVDFLRANPSVIYFANDGGIYRTTNSFNTAVKTCKGTAQPYIQFDNLNGTMGSMIQYVWFSQHPSDASILLGGTQDNGSMAKNSSAAISPQGYGYTWQSVNNGDGGWNDINPTNPLEWFTSSSSVYLASDGIMQCTNSSSAITCGANTFQSIIKQSTLGGDNASFYYPFMLDPQAANHMLVGTCRLWRIDRQSTTSWAAPSTGALTYNLDQFSTSGTAACADTANNMLNAIAVGGPCNGTCNPGANPGNATGNGSQVIYIGTAVGKVFVTTNTDGGPTTWQDRSAGLNNTSSTNCTVSPCGYPISGIAVDARDATGKTAYVTVMGFNTGHVFKTTDAGATWTQLDGNSSTTGLPDNPADAVTLDPTVPNLVYVATDVGVFQSSGDLNWTEVGPSSGAGALPNVATTMLRSFNSGTPKLRVSTYGRGIWEIPINNSPGFLLAVTPPSAMVTPGQSATFSGTITPYNGYNSTITISCPNLAAGVTCTPAQQILSAGATSFSLSMSGTTVGDYTVTISAVGGDAAAFTQQVAVVLHVADVSLTGPVPATLSIGHGTSGTTSVTVNSLGSYSGTVSLACGNLPADVTCTFTPVTLSMQPGNSVVVQLSVSVGTATSVGTYTIPIDATPSPGTTQSVNVALTVTLNPTFTLSAGPAPLIVATQSGQQTITVGSQDGYTGSVTLVTEYIGASISPNVVTVPGTAAVQIPATSKDMYGPSSVRVTGTDTNNNVHQLDVPFTVANYTVGPVAGESGNVLAVPGGSATLAFVVSGQSGYVGNVTLNCDSHLLAGSTCALSPATTIQVGATPVSMTATVTIPSTASSNNYRVTISSNDVSLTGLAHDYTPTVGVQDYQLVARNGGTGGSAAIINAGASATFALTLNPLGGFSGSVTFDPATVCSGLPTLTTCTLSQTSLTAGGSVNLTIKTTASTIAAVRPARTRGFPLWAFWLGLPGAAGILFAGSGRRKRIVSLGWALMLAALLAMGACGGGGGSGTTSPPPVPKPGTPAGTYTITVSGTSGSGTTALTRSTQVTLTVN